MSIEKENFLRTRLITHLQQINPSTSPRWGKMSVHHMIEHLEEYAFRIANGRSKYDVIVTPTQHLDKYRAFLFSEKPFKENTVSPIISNGVLPLRYKTVQAAIGGLHQEMIYFFEVYDKDPRLVIRNPIFGDLNFEENVQLLHKHVVHHLKQFGVESV